MAKKPTAKKRSSNGRRYTDILYEVKDHVAWATINRPRVLNAFREQTLDEMIDALKSTREDPSIVCAVVTGAGDKGFSAGGGCFVMGGGHERALWCDLVIASDNAVLGQTGAKVGACPTVGATQYIPRLIGERLAREMIFCARRFTAKGAGEGGPLQQRRA